MTDILVKGLTGTPAEVTLFTDANIVNHAAIVSGTLLNIAYTKTISNVSSLYFTNRDKSLLGSWPAAGTHVQIPTTYTPTDYAPFVCKPSVLTIGNTVHVLWAYFIKQDGYISTVEIGTGYAGGTLGIESYVSYNGLTYINPTNALLQSAIDSDAEVDALIAGIPDVNPGEWLVEPQLVEVTIVSAAPKGTHHTVNNMVVEYFFSADAGLTWLSEVVIDKVANTNMIYTGTDFVFNTSASDDSGMLYLAISGYNDTTSDNTDYDNFLQVIKGNLNSWSYAKKYNVFNTQGSSAIDAPSLLTYNINDIDFMLSCVKESASINSNHNLDLMIPDYDNDAPQKYMCINKSIASTFTFPPDEPIPDPVPPVSANSLSSVIRNAYADKPFGKIEITSTGDIWTGGWAESQVSIRTSPNTTIYAPSEFVTIGINHSALFNEQIVKSGAIAPYVWYRVKKPNTTNVRPLGAAFIADALNDSGDIAAAVLSEELQVVQESEIFPANGIYGCLELYSPTGTLIKQIDPSSWPVYGTPRATSEPKIIRDFVIDKNDNLWISYGYDNYNPAPQHWCLGFYDTATDIQTPILCAASQSNTMKHVVWQIYNSVSGVYTSSSVEAYKIASPGNETIASFTARLKANVEYITGLTISNPSIGELTLPTGYVWKYLSHQITGHFDNTFVIHINSTGFNTATLTITNLTAPSDTNGSWFFHDNRGDGGNIRARFTASKDGLWVAYHGFVNNYLGATDCILFNADTALPPAPNLANYPAGSKASHVRIFLAGEGSERPCVNAVHIDGDIVWLQTAANNGVNIDSSKEKIALHRMQLPTATSTDTQHIIMSTGETSYSYTVTNELSICSTTSNDDLEKNIVNVSGRVNAAQKNRAVILSDDTYVYVIHNHINHTLGVNIYNKSGRFYKRAILQIPDAYINTYTYYNANARNPGYTSHATMAESTAIATHSDSAVRGTIDDNGTIVYCGTYEFNTSDLLKTSNVKLLSYHHSFTAGNVNSNSEFTIKTASTTAQHYVYVGASWATATKKAKLLEISHPPASTLDPDYTSSLIINAAMVIEKIEGEFVAGDLIKEYNGTADTNSHAILTAGECDYINNSAYLLDAYSPHLAGGAAGWSDRTSNQVYKDNKLYISNNIKEIKTYTSAVIQTEEITVSSVCTSNGSIVLLLDDKVKSGRGAAVSFNKATPILSAPFANIPGAGYNVGDIVYVGDYTAYATFSVTSIDSYGGITGVSMSTDDSLVDFNYAQGGIFNSYNVKNFCAVTVNLNTTNHSSINNVANAIRDAINLSGLAVASAANGKVTVTYKNMVASYRAIQTLSNDTGVTFKTNRTKPLTKLASPIPAINVLTVSHTLTESIPNQIFNRIRDALSYAETNGSAGDWYTLLLHPGAWYEDVRPNPSGTTQKCNYVIKAVSEDLQYQSSLRTVIAGFRTKYYNTACSRTSTGLILPVNITSHGLKAPDSITVTSTTNAAFCPLGTYAVTRTSGNQFTIDTGISASVGSGVTIQFTINVDGIPSNPDYPQHGRGLIEIKESGILDNNRVMVFEGLIINNAYVPVIITTPETGARYLMKRLHSSSVASNETVIFNKCCIYNQWSAVTAPGDANDTHYFNSRNYGYIENTAAVNTFTAVYYNSIMGRANQNYNPTFYTNDSGSLSASETINIYNIGSSFSHGLANGFNNHVNYTYALKSMNSTGETHYAIGYATNNTSAITQQPIGNVYGHSSILNHVGGTETALDGGYYYLDAVNWFDDAGNLQLTIPSDVHLTMITRSWSPRE